jgi:hypothetical protein
MHGSVSWRSLQPGALASNRTCPGGTCEFEASCGWRLAKIEELRKKRQSFAAKEVNK